MPVGGMKVLEEAWATGKWEWPPELRKRSRSDVEVGDGRTIRDRWGNT